jgi:hypothetical protein
MYVEAVKFAITNLDGTLGGGQGAMVLSPQRISNNSRPLVVGRFFRFLTLYLNLFNLARMNKKYKIVYSFMV